MPIVRGNSPANSLRSGDAAALRARARHLLRLHVALTWLTTGAIAASLLTYLPAPTAWFFAALLAAAVPFFAAFLLLARAGSPRVRLNLVRGLLLGARMRGRDFAGLVARSSWAIRGSAVAAVVAVLPLFALGGSSDLFGGAVETRDGRPVEVSHGRVVRGLTDHEAEQMQMENLRFALALAVVFQVVGSLIVSGAMTELPPIGEPLRL